MQISNEQLIDVLKTICKTDASGNKWWFLNGQQHRADGPAVEYANGNKFWYLNGQELTEEEFNYNTHTYKLNDANTL